MTETMTEASFRCFLAERREEVEAALRRCVGGLAALVPAPVRAAVQDGALGGGKRLRPILLVTACEELGGETGEAVYDLSVSVELIHAYSLLHDDLPCMDDAPVRRGRPTAHVTHGVRAAAVAGAAMIPWAAAWAFESALRAGRNREEARGITLHLLEAAGAGGMIGGQALDLLAEDRSPHGAAPLDEAGLKRLHGMKTGALLTASLEIGAMAAGGGAAVLAAMGRFGRGAMAAGGDAAVLAAMGRFGRGVGLAFQVMDDVLDATGSAEVLGKRPSDSEHGKSTYVQLLGVDGARNRARALVARATASLDAAGLAAPRLRELARFVIERRR